MKRLQRGSKPPTGQTAYFETVQNTNEHDSKKEPFGISLNAFWGNPEKVMSGILGSFLVLFGALGYFFLLFSLFGELFGNSQIALRGKSEKVSFSRRCRVFGYFLLVAPFGVLFGTFCSFLPLAPNPWPLRVL